MQLPSVIVKYIWVDGDAFHVFMFRGRVLVEVQRARPLDAPKNLHLTVPKSGSNTAQQYVDGYAFFHVHCSTKVKGKSQRSKIFNSQVSYQKKMYVFYSSSWITFLKFKRQASKSHRCQDGPSTLQHLSDSF